MMKKDHKCWKCGRVMPGSIKGDLCDLHCNTVTGTGPCTSNMYTEGHSGIQATRISTGAWRKPKGHSRHSEEE